MPQTPPKQNAADLQSIQALTVKVKTLETQLKKIQKELQTFKQTQTNKIAGRSDAKAVNDLRQKITKI